VLWENGKLKYQRILPVDAQHLCEHPPVVAEGVGGVEALAELLPEGAREPEGPEGLGVGPGARGPVRRDATDDGDLAQGPRHAARGYELLRAVVDDPEDLASLRRGALADLELVGARGPAGARGLQLEAHVLEALATAPELPEAEFPALGRGLALPLVADLLEADQQRAAPVLEGQAARLVQEAAPQLGLPLGQGLARGLGILDRVHPEAAAAGAAAATLARVHGQPQPLGGARALAAPAREDVGAKLLGHEEDLRVVELREQGRVYGLVAQGQELRPEGWLVLGPVLRGLEALAAPDLELPGGRRLEHRAVLELDDHRLGEGGRRRAAGHHRRELRRTLCNGNNVAQGQNSNRESNRYYLHIITFARLA
jgi:hypothetical protein